MYIPRDITSRLSDSHAPVQFLIGPRQCGKSTLLSHLAGSSFKEVTFDDLQLRTLANRDPGLFLEQFKPPVLLDEVQYVPHLFPEIKRYVDEQKRRRIETGHPIPALFRMTGSNQLLLDRNVKESLAGRVSYFYLNTLTVHEIKKAFDNADLVDILFQGGWPELYIDRSLSPVVYLNDYIHSYIEKDIVLSAGVQKQGAFGIVLGLLAARTGMLLDYANMARDSGIRGVTVKEWISILERTALVQYLKPYANNLNLRLTKTPKLYFMDTGLAVRLQGWQERTPLLTSPQAGALFETLVFSEILKFIQNYGKDWKIHLWRTKEGEEIDFVVIADSGDTIALDAKMSLQATQAIRLPESFKKHFPHVSQIVLVTFGGHRIRLSRECLAVPVAELHDFLTERSG
ncbi:MAG: ATP-binding protein [Leptospirales bacterium]